jgi:hypothetical protein
MDATWIITTFVLIDTLMECLAHQSDVRARVPDSEVILIAVVAAKYFANHQERAVCILRESGYLSAWIDVTRFNRRLHKLADWLAFIARTLGEIRCAGEVFVIDSLPFRCAGGCVPDAVAKFVAATTAAIVPPRRRSSSAGDCT